MLTTLKQKVDPQNAALIVVDVQNDFAATDGAMGREGFDCSMSQEMAPRLVRFIDETRKAKVPIIYIQNVYNSEPNWYLSEVWLEHAARRRNNFTSYQYNQRDFQSRELHFLGGRRPRAGLQ